MSSIAGHHKLQTLLVLSVLSFFLILTGCSQQAGQLPDIEPDLSLDVKPLPEFASYKNVQKKKAAFFSYILPIVRAHNAHIRRVRDAALALKDQELTQQQKEWLQSLTGYYELQSTLKDGKAFWKGLFRRVDAVPASLALAQAANESAWGTSRFARKGNNLFGEWCFIEGCGIVPKHRPKGATYEVADFPTVVQSVGSYMHNLNTNSAYQPLRDIRAKLRRQGKPLSGLALAQGLVRYSSRGQAYIKDISSMITYNKLSQYDHANRGETATK